MISNQTNESHLVPIVWLQIKQINYWNVEMSIQISFVGKQKVTNQTTEGFHIFMNSFGMFIQITFTSKWFLANQTSESFFISMNCPDMFIQITFMSKQLLTYQTGEWFHFLMNCPDMCIQMSILHKLCFANWTFELFYFFLYHFAASRRNDQSISDLNDFNISAVGGVANKKILF